MFTLREVIDTEQKNEVLMFANSPCIWQLLLCRFQDTTVIRKFFVSQFILLLSRLQYIYQFKGTIMQIENQLINDRSHNFVVIHA